MRGYIYFGKAGEPMQTVGCDVKLDASKRVVRHVTQHKIKFENRWYRVYQVGLGEFYVKISGERVGMTFSYQHL